MKRETKKQIFAIFVLLLFVGSSIAYAIGAVLGRPAAPEQETLVFDYPLTDSETAKLLENNIVVADLYYSQNAESSTADSMIRSLVQDFAGYLAVDRIDGAKYKTMAEANDVTQLPSFVLKGLNGLDTIPGSISKQELKDRICRLYAEPIGVCLQ